MIGKDITIIPQIGFAKNTTDEERYEFSKFGEFVTLKEGDVLIEEGEKQHCLFMVINGEFYVQTNLTGRTIILNIITSGGSIGEINIFDSGKASASVISKSDSKVWKITKSQLDRYLVSHSQTAIKILMNISIQLSRKLRITNEKVTLARDAIFDSFNN